MRLRHQHTRVPSRMLTVCCRFFARYRELLGHEHLTLELPEGATAGDAVAAVRAKLERGAALPERPLVAVNHEHVLPGHVLSDGDEVAFLPPLAGG